MDKKKNICITILFTAILFGNYIGIYLYNEYLLKIIYIFLISLSFKLFVNKKAKIQIFLWLVTTILILVGNSNAQIIAILAVCLLLVLEDSARFNGLIIEGLIFTMIASLYENLSIFFSICNEVSYMLTKLFNMGTPLGESVSAIIEVTILMACSVIMICNLGIKSIKFEVFKLTVLFMIIYVIYLNVLTFLLTEVPQIGNNTLFIVGIIMIIYNSIVQMMYESNYLELNRDKSPNNPVSKKYIISLIGICAISIIGLNIISILSDNRQNKITIVNEGTLVNVQDRLNIVEEGNLGYGVRDNIFSLLPHFLKINEYDVKIVQRIEEVDWNESNNVIFINYNKEIENDVKSTIKKFTLEGGTICVFTDHTNMDGIMDAANSIMSFTDLKIKNDISDPFLHSQGKDWTNSLHYFNTYSTYGIGNNNKIQVWGGASIENNIFIEPIVIGKYGFSDKRDKFNGGVGGFLGDRVFERKELGGNTILAAKQKIGKGEVYAFGDASYIQTPALFFNSRFMSRIFYEASDKQVVDFSILKIGSAVLLICTVFLSLRKDKLEKFSLLGMYIGIILSIFINFGICKLNDSKIVEVQSKNITAVDYSLAEDFDIEMLNDKSIAGCMFNLYKSIEYPVITDKWQDTLESKNMVLVAPQKKIDSKQIQSMKKYLEKGNNIIIVAGWEHYQNIKGFVNEYGIYLDNVALGPVPYNNESIGEVDYNNPEFKEAYPIIINNSNIQVVHNFGKYNLVIMTNIDNGGKLIYISDSRFFNGKNIEDETSGKSYNINFVKKMLGELL